MKDPEHRSAILAELERIGLDVGELAGLAVTHSAELLAHLRTLKPGSSWHDAFPDVPKDWDPRDRRNLKAPYRPYGSYDYQELPTGPAVDVYWQKTEPHDLDALVAEAKRAGWPIYGAGFHHASNPDWPFQSAFVVLQRGTTEDRFGEFTLWFEARKTPTIAGIYFRPDEWYVA